MGAHGRHGDGLGLIVAPFVLSGDPVPLAIDEGPYAGAQMTVLTDVPLDVGVGIGALMTRFADAEAGSPEEATALSAAWTLFAGGVLVEWNLLDRYGAVPIDASAFRRLPPRLIVQVLGRWADLMVPKAEEA